MRSRLSALPGPEAKWDDGFKLALRIPPILAASVTRASVRERSIGKEMARFGAIDRGAPQANPPKHFAPLPVWEAAECSRASWHKPFEFSDI